MNNQHQWRDHIIFDTLTVGDDGTPTFQSVKGSTIADSIGVHKTASEWAITHLTTGRALGYTIKKDTARRTAERLLQVATPDQWASITCPDDLRHQPWAAKAQHVVAAHCIGVVPETDEDKISRVLKRRALARDPAP